MNEIFLNRMQELLKDEYEAYLKTLDQSAYRGLRANLLKISPAALADREFTVMEPSPFAPEGFRIPSDARLGNHVYHRQGLFYLQEPSASSAVTVLNPQPGDWVLDLCAAPGGKSTQIASRLGNTGFLISNEIDSGRARILMGNLERLGVSEAMVTQASPEQLCPLVAGWMDKVLVDAPCSGEGMFKKEDRALSDWSPQHVAACSMRQRKILDSAVLALKADGILVYSTCTYARAENEEVVADFLRQHPEMELLDCAVEFGRPGVEGTDLDHRKVRRIFPMDGGEGHFIARMRRRTVGALVKKRELKSQPVPQVVADFLQEQLGEYSDYHVHAVQDKFWIMRQPWIELKGIHVLRQGILAGDIIKNRVEPHHHFYMAAALQERFRKSAVLSEEQLSAYLRGEQISLVSDKGFLCLFYQSFPVGFGKSDGREIKNKYPKGLRSRE